jgi:hypothetical protein
VLRWVYRLGQGDWVGENKLKAAVGNGGMPVRGRKEVADSVDKGWEHIEGGGRVVAKVRNSLDADSGERAMTWRYRRDCGNQPARGSARRDGAIARVDQRKMQRGTFRQG